MVMANIRYPIFTHLSVVQQICCIFQNTEQRAIMETVTLTIRVWDWV